MGGEEEERMGIGEGRGIWEEKKGKKKRKREEYRKGEEQESIV